MENPKKHVWLRRVRPRTSYHGSTVSIATTEGPSCQQGDMSECAQNTMPKFELDKLPDDILCHVHSLVPLRDAARLACLSRSFLRSWRCFPNLTFKPGRFFSNVCLGTPFETPEKLADRIDHILQNHSGTGVKTLELNLAVCGKRITDDRINNWLQAAVKPGILEIALTLQSHFNLSCSHISCAGSSLQSITLRFCAFHPALRPGCFKSLKSLLLYYVDITSEGLGFLLSSTVSLEKLEISHCDQITFLNIPSHLQQLSTLTVSLSNGLQMIEIYAPKLTNFYFHGPPTTVLTSDSSHLKYLTLNGVYCSGMIQYARTELHSIASNLRSLVVISSKETFNTPAVLSEKFLHLRKLVIDFSGILFRSYDYFSLSSFLQACPALETFCLWAGQCDYVRPDPELEDFSADSLDIRRIPEFHHAKLKKVAINRFFSSKSLIELTYLIIEKAPSLRYLLLDTSHGFDRITGKRVFMRNQEFIQAIIDVEVAKRYIEGKVPPSVRFKLFQPCKQCHLISRRRLHLQRYCASKICKRRRCFPFAWAYI
ncbi:hypothetical protein ABZP36_035797 [Zizania latifolia]